MAYPWKKTVDELPVSLDQCFIRLSPSYGPIVSAEFDDFPGPYSWKLNHLDAGKIPAWMVARWKPDSNPAGTPSVPSSQILPWRFTISDLPPADAGVLIRVPGFYGEPVFARFLMSTTPWVFRIKEDPEFDIPFYLVPRWKYA